MFHGIKLTREDAVMVMRLAVDGVLTKDIAKAFGVSRITIQQLLRGQTWKDLPRPQGLPRKRGTYTLCRPLTQAEADWVLARAVKPVSCSVDGCDQDAKAAGYCLRHYGRLRRHGDPTAGGTPSGERLRFAETATKFTGDSCLLWPFSANPSRYGALKIAGKTIPAHRFVCQAVHGDPPTPRHEAAHSCNNRRCVNPKHLRWATPAENQADRLIHGTASRGSRHGLSKLTEAQVIGMRKLHGTMPIKRIAEKYGISPTHAGLILSGKSWSWLEQPHESEAGNV